MVNRVISEGAKAALSTAQKFLKDSKKKKLKATNKDVFDVLSAVDEKVKSGKAEKNPSKLLQQAEEVTTGENTVKVGKGKVEKTEIGKRDFKVKVDEQTKETTEQFLKSFGETDLPRKTLIDFNISKINANDDILKLIDLTSKNMQGKAKQTRGVRTNKTTKALASRYMKNDAFVAEVLGTKAGTMYNAEKILAIRKLLLAGENRLKYLAQKVTDTDNASNIDLVRFRQHYALMSQIQKVLTGVKTETGRALQSFKIPVGVDKKYSFVGGDVGSLNRQSLIVELGGPDEITKVAEMYLKVPNVNQRLKAVNETGLLSFSTRTSNAISEVFINAILSNPLTHVRNGVGNWITQAVVDTERKLASRLFGKFDRGSGQNYISKYEDIAKAWGKHMAAQEIMAAMKNTYKLGGSKLDQRVGQVTSQNFNIKNKNAAYLFDTFGKGITLGNLPTKALQVADDYFKNREFRSEIYARAFSDGMEMFEKGLLKKDALADYIAGRVANPDKDMLAAAYKQAQYVTYQTPLGKRDDLFDLAKIGQQAKSYASNRGPWSWFVNYYLPFVRTPTNIAGFVAERTPIAAQILTRYNKAIKEGGRAAAEARAKLALGSMFYMATAPLGYYGMTKGSDIRGTGSRLSGSKFSLQQSTQNLPFDVQIPIGDNKNFRFSTRGFDPISQMLANSANFGQMLSMLQGVYQNNISDQDDANYSQAAKDALIYSIAFSFSVGENLANSTLLTGAGKAIDDIRNITQGFSSGGLEGGKKALKQAGGQMASSYIPLFVKEGAKLFNDDHQKLTVEFSDYFKNRVAEGGMEYKYDHRGRRIDKFSYLSTIEKDDYDNELFSVLPNLTPIQNTIPYEYSRDLGLSVSVPLNAAEKRFLMKNAGINFDRNIKNLMNSNLYKSETRKVVRKGLLQNAWKAAKGEARDALLSDTFYDDGEGNKVNFFLNIKERGEELRDKDLAGQQGGYRVDDYFNNNN